MEMQCSLGTIRLVYDWDRDHQLMSNQKPLTHYRMTSLEFFVQRGGGGGSCNFQPSIRGGSVSFKPEGRGGS